MLLRRYKGVLDVRVPSSRGKAGSGRSIRPRHHDLGFALNITCAADAITEYAKAYVLLLAAAGVPAQKAVQDGEKYKQGLRAPVSLGQSEMIIGATADFQRVEQIRMGT